MSGTVATLLSNASNVLAYALVDYATDNFLAPMAGRTSAGAYAVSGVNFHLKVIASEMHPFAGISGKLLG